MTDDQVLMDVDRISIRLIAREPFYGHFFTHLVKTVTKEVPTAAIGFNHQTNTMVLMINPEFWAKIKGRDQDETDEMKYGVIKHEILHILFKHPFMHGKYTDRNIENVAKDVLVNQYILESQLPEKEHLAMEQNFKDFNLEKDQTTDYYYATLKKEWDKAAEILENERNSGGSKSGSSGGGTPPSSGSGDPSGEEGTSPPKLQDEPGWDKLNKSQQHLMQFVQNNPKLHSTWQGIKELDSGRQDFVKNWVDTTTQNAVRKAEISKGSTWRGTLPAGLVSFIDELVESLKPVADWKRVLKLMSSNAERTFRQGTLKRPSKRYGTYPGSKLKRYTKVMLAIDTSGSVDNDSLMECFSELYHIFKAGASVHVVECDTTIGKKWDYEGKWDRTITGRGGTDFNEPIEYANEEYRPDFLIYFTDGYAPPPDIDSNCPIMWILAKNHSKEVDQMEDFQGIKIKMDY